MGFKMWQIGEGENCPCCGSSTQNEGCGCRYPCNAGNEICQVSNSDSVTVTLIGSGSTFGNTCRAPGSVDNFFCVSKMEEPISTDVTLYNIGSIFNENPLYRSNCDYIDYENVKYSIGFTCAGISIQSYCDLNISIPIVDNGTLVFEKSSCKSLFFDIYVNSPPLCLPVQGGRCNDTIIIAPWRIFNHAIVNFNADSIPSGFCANFCVSLCGSGVAGVNVSVSDPSNHNLIVEGMTNPGGCVNLNVGNSGFYTITLNKIGFPTIVSNQEITCKTYNYNYNQNFICCGGVAIPINLTLSDANGSIDFVYNSNSSNPIWTGSYKLNKNSCAVTVENNTCNVNQPSQGPVKVCYQMTCQAGQEPQFNIQRSWSWVYQPATSNPIYYQDNTLSLPGRPCSTSPPSICGSSFTDMSSCGLDIFSNNPLMLGGYLTSSASNVTDDPVIGGVTIS